VSSAPEPRLRLVAAAAYRRFDRDTGRLAGVRELASSEGICRILEKEGYRVLGRVRGHERYSHVVCHARHGSWRYAVRLEKAQSQVQVSRGGD
jgi:hypothetical protein